MTERVKTICEYLPRVGTFADIGCDHGYMAEYVLRNGLARTVYISDISAGSLQKAKELLARYIQSGTCIPVHADGMKGLPKDLDFVLIAGMGGEEIVRILEEGYLPRSFLLQPMKNAEKVRAFLIQQNCNLTLDFTFGKGYFYDLILGETGGGSFYNENELLFGRDNLRKPNAAFLQKLGSERTKLEGYLQKENLSKKSREKIEDRLNRIRSIQKEL